MKKISMVVVIFLGLMLLPILPANATLIDLNDFFADPTVTVSADGSSALMEEDSTLASVLLVNDPFFGDPIVIIPGPGIFLTFNYDFIEAPGEDDEFGAYVFYTATGVSAGTEYEFFTDVTAAGTTSFDLTGLTGESLGLLFELASLPPNDMGLNSTVTVFDVTLAPASGSAPVPEPATLFLFGTGLLGLLGLGRKKFRK